MPPIIYFFLSLVTLILGYLVYGRLVERVFQPDAQRPTPALTITDNVDYMPLNIKELFLNQFLSISAIGPVFGAILGVLYGPMALVWIVFGCIFAGGVHDYLSGMISLRYKGASMPETVGLILGPFCRWIMVALTSILLLLLGVVLAQAPADLLASLTRIENDAPFWLALIFIYYFLATIWPIEVLINRFNPFFTGALIFMAIGVAAALIFGDYEVYQGADWSANHPLDLPLWPLMFVTIACGALSGFHATQSPITARCLTNERQGRQIFYGAMILEGAVALIWATAGMTVFPSAAALQDALTQGGPSGVIHGLCMNLLGEMGGTIAVLGVVVLPITSGDTAFRANRFLAASILGVSQQHVLHRVAVALPIFGLGIFLSQVDFGVIWRYVGWANQALATISLWAGAAYLVRLGANYWFAAVPATFITAVTATYILHTEVGFRLPYQPSLWLGAAAAVLALILFLACRQRFRDKVPLFLD